MVLMRHPKLPEDQVIKAMPQQVQAYQHSGWEVIPDPPEGPPADSDSPPTTASEDEEAPASAGASALPDQSPRRRRAPKEGDE
jgi:hypothetical protein